jgi:acyl-CoA synthetase (AMP-forming)/AMP-acid ligase II
MEQRLGCPVVVGYTSTEAAITTGTRPGDTPEVIHRTVGRPRDTVALRIVDDAVNDSVVKDSAVKDSAVKDSAVKDSVQTVATGQVGRVQCKSEAVMRGYWRDPQRTAQVLDTDGWLTTGDLGYLDEQGYLTLVGRRSEMYIRGGYNVYPAEVERVLADHPGVRQVAIVGRPDPVLGEIGVAFVVPAGPSGPAADELRAWTRRSLADYKAPDLVELVPELPLTAMAKIDKHDLAKRAAILQRP